MIYDYHVVFGLATIPLFVLGYGLYFRSIFRGETKPHLFTWLSYVFIDGTIFVAQLTSGGGVGSWVLGLATLINAGIVVVSFWRGEKRIHSSDWLCLLGVFVGIGLWLITDGPLGAVVVLTIINTVALIPTFRKAYEKPLEESVSIWSVDVFKFMLTVVALEQRTLTTALFPVGIIVINALLVAMILVRRRQLAKRGGGDTIAPNG